MCGGGGSAPEPTMYTARDGTQFDNPQAAQEHDRKLALRDAFSSATPVQEQVLQPGDEGYLEAAFGDAAMVPETYRDSYLQEAAPGPVTIYSEAPGQKLGRDVRDRYINQGLTAADFRNERRLEEQRRQEELAAQQRENLIGLGDYMISDAFGNTFNDDYYNNYQQSSLDYYMPQLQDQYQDARENVTFDLARKGTLQSSTAGETFGDLSKRFEQQKGDVTNRVQDMVDQAREAASQARSSLQQYNQSVADPRQVDQRLTDSIDRVQAQAPETTPLGQAFSDYLTAPLTTAAQVGGAAAKKYGPTLFDSKRSGSSSSYNVQR